MRLATLILLLAAPAWAQVEERCGRDFLVAFTPGDSRLWIYDSSGRQTSEIDVTAGARGPLVHIRDVAVSGSGRVVVAGSWTATNAGYVVLSAPGHAANAVDTWPFAPSKIVFGPEDLVWLYGGEPHELRRYSAAGEHLGQANLPADTLPALSYFGSSNSRVALWFRDTSRWIEFDPDGQPAMNADLPPPPALDARVVLTDANEIYGGSGESLYRFHRRKNRWIPASEAPPTSMPATLVGSHGPRLILRTDTRRLVSLPI